MPKHSENSAGKPGVDRRKREHRSKRVAQLTFDGLLFDRKQIKHMYLRAYYKRNRKRLIRAAVAWGKANVERRRKTVRNSDHRRREANTARRRHQRRTNLNCRLLSNLRHRVWSALKRQRTHKNNTTVNLVGCSIPELRAHLESHFQPGMNWKNYGEWHVDHHVPCAAFDLSDERQQRTCFHYTNLRPLWALNNRIKGAGR